MVRWISFSPYFIADELPTWFPNKFIATKGIASIYNTLPAIMKAIKAPMLEEKLNNFEVADAETKSNLSK